MLKISCLKTFLIFGLYGNTNVSGDCCKQLLVAVYGNFAASHLRPKHALRMKFFPIIVFTLLINIRGISQDSLYANRIDSLWLNSYNKRELKNKGTNVGDASVQYSFYKRSGRMRSILSLNSVARENLIFFYLEDKIVMIWPSGQRPYFILNDRLVYAEQMRHTTKQVENLIARAYNYLEQGYKKIKGTRN